MSRNKRHCHQLPDGRLAITTIDCEDNDNTEVDKCHKTQFELGRAYLNTPSNVEGYTTITELGLNWRNLVHFIDWVRWGEPLPLTDCHCIDESQIPTDRSQRNKWALQGHSIIIRE
jgi:hypothetical protein